MKQKLSPVCYSETSSHPSRVRGLKHIDDGPGELVVQVAPFTGAWIETDDLKHQSLVNLVAPFTGAWIETRTARSVSWKKAVSHPSRVRGLKLFLVRLTGKLHHVAPFTGAWIETSLWRLFMIITISVAPFTGAWIETPMTPIWRPLVRVAPFTGAWIETK